MKIAIISAILSTLCFANAVAEPLEKMPRDLEVKFALSALPTEARAEATVYVLDPAKGYVLDHRGTNAQTCFVERTDWTREDYSNDVYTALCYDPVGMKAQGKVWFDVAEMRASGKPPSELKKEIQKRFDDGTYHAPERPGVSYMSAPLMRTYASFDLAHKEKRTYVMPHVMYYAPYIKDADYGSKGPGSPFPFILDQGPHGYFIQTLGVKETEDILKTEAPLIKELCAYKNTLCLTEESSMHSH